MRNGGGSKVFESGIRSTAKLMLMNSVFAVALCALDEEVDDSSEQLGE